MLVTLLNIVIILVSVAFFTLIERNVMAAAHNRKGPSKSSFNGIIQPISDATNLLIKEWININSTNNIIIIASPIMGVLTYIIVWAAMPASTSSIIINVSGIYVVAVLATSIMFLMSTGWASNSNYSIIGSYRATAQAISYEVSIAVIMLSAIIVIKDINFININETKISTKLVFTPFIVVWIVNCLAETNNTPFDFTEGESELVSGFNTEFYGAIFSIIFIAEYCALIFIIIITSILYVQSNTAGIMTIATMLLLLVTTARITIPRIRYDNMITIAWAAVIPTAIFMLILLLIL